MRKVNLRECLNSHTWKWLGHEINKEKHVFRGQTDLKFNLSSATEKVL